MAPASHNDAEVQCETSTRAEKNEVANQPEVNEANDANNVDPSPKKSFRFWLAFAGIASSLFVFQLDAMILGIALPTIANDLNGQSLQSFWANLSYTLCGLVMQPVWANTSNIFGRKPPLYICMAFFFVGSIVFATAKNMNTLIIGRALQGFGGGGIDVLAEVILADMTTLQERSKYIGLLGITMAVGNIMGPAVGALLATYASWRWIGWINLPLLGISYPLILFFLRLRRLESSLLEKTKQLDWTGMLLFSVGCIAFVLPLSWAGTLYPWSSWRTILPLLIGALVLGAFAWYEARPEKPIMPHRLFGRTASATLVGAFLHGMMLFSLMQYLPFFYQAVQRQTLIQSAVTLLPTSIASVLAAGLSVTAVGLVRSYRWSVWASWVLVTVGTGLLAIMSDSSTKAMSYGAPVIWGAGIGALLRVLHLPLQASVPH
ncbi:hypothetical protein Golomagni_05387, partial [Golovinomyces magnicellulatus]